MSSLTVEEDQKWVPTHVQVTVLRGRSLRGKGKHGTSDVYTIIQLGKEKYSTGVAEKTTEPEWREECSFELQPGVLQNGGQSNELVLTVMHRALIGMDVFLGKAVIQLDKLYLESRCMKNEWYRLNSKTGKKEKERGDIQVTVQFTRNNLTASMYDLVMKDKGASTFGKLKERMKGKRRSSDEDSSSAVLPGGYGSLCRMRQRLPSDGGGEEDYEDDEGGEVRRSKMRTFFLRGKLRKSSDTRSSTSLGSESSESSSRGGSLSPTAGISVVVSDLSNSPSNSSNLTVDNSPEHTANTSPKSSSSLKCEFGDEPGEITIAVPPPSVYRSHAHTVQPLDPGSGKPAGSLGLGLLQKSLPLSISLQNLSPRAPTDLPKGPVGDGRRWSFDKPGEEEKAAIAAALEQSGPMVAEDEEEDERLGRAAPPKAASSAMESESQGKKQRRNFFSHGRSESAGKGQSQSKDESEQALAAAEEKHRGWFGSKDSHSKPSLVVSPKLESSTDPHPPPLPRSHHPPGPPVAPAPLVSPLHHSNPFCHSQSTPPPISPCNPFFSLLQHNPFYEDILTAQPLKSSLPPLPYLSSSRPPITQLFPQASNPNPTLTHPNPTAEDSIGAKSKVMAKAEKRPLPPTPTEVKPPLSKRPSNPFMSVGELEPDSEWDESFEAFAAGRLQSPEDLTTDCKTQQNTSSGHPPEHCNNKGALLPVTDADQNTPHHQPCTDFAFEAHKATGQVTNTNTYHFDMFAQFLETIPEHTSFESDNLTLNTPTNSPELAACTGTNQANSTTNTEDLTSTNMHQPPCDNSSVKLNSSSPDPGSSGLGSSAEEDFLSCVSSYSDKFSASSSEEAEAQNSESNILSFEKSSEPAVVKNFKPSQSEDDITDRSNDLSLDVDQHTVIQHRDGDEKVVLAGPLAPQSPVLTHQQPVITAGESQAPKLSELQTKSNISLQSDSENGEKDTGEFNRSLQSFSKVLNDSCVSVSNISATPDDELCSTHPSLRIITSSPDVRQGLSDSPTSLGGQDASRPSPIPFGDFLNTSHIANSPSQDITLLHTQVSDQSNSSFLQSLYVSTDSQDYQTCVSHPSSKCSSGSELNETLHSVNSTLCGELSEIETTADAALGQDDSISACKPSNEEINQSDQEHKINTATIEPSIIIEEDFGLEGLPVASTESFKTSNPEELIEGGVKSQHVVLDDVFSSGLDPNKMLHSANSMICAKLSEIQTTADATLDQDDSTTTCKQSNEKINPTEPSFMIEDGLEVLTDSYMSCNPGKLTGDELSETQMTADAALGQDCATACKPSNKEINQTDQEPEVNTPTLEPYFMIGDGLEVLPVASTESLMSCNTKDIEGGVESPLVFVGDADAALGQEGPTTGCKQPNEEISPADQFEESVCGAKNKTATIEPSFMIADGLEALPASSVESLMSGNPSKLVEGGVESHHVLLGDSNNACKQSNDEINPIVQFEESLFGAEDNRATLEPNFMIGDDFGLATDSYMNCNPRKLTEGGVESQHNVLDDVFSKRPRAQSSTLHRSQSEGTLISVFDEHLLPSFGSDPGAIQETSLAQPDPDHPSLTSFAPSLTPDNSSSPVALCSLPLARSSPPSTARAAAPKPLPQETQQLQQQAANQQNSPHPVKPLTTAMLAEEKRTEGRSVLATGLEKLKSTIHPGRSSQLSEQETEKKKPLTEGAGSYYHLNHSELVALLVQREAELERQRAEFERQKCLLAKREVELRKLKPQVRDLEDYIDTLLVRIMEQKPTLLQVRSKLK